MHSLKMPPGSPAYRTGNEAPLNEIVKTVTPSARTTGAFVDGPLQPDPSVVVAPVAHVDLVDVAVVVDGRCEELGHDDTAGDHDQCEDQDRQPVALAPACDRRAIDVGARCEIKVVGDGVVRRGEIGVSHQSQYFSSSGTCSPSLRPDRTVRHAKSATVAKVKK